MTSHLERVTSAEWESVPLPFYRNPSDLPAPLPLAKDFLESGVVLHGDASYHRVVAIGNYFLVKHGRGVSELEGQNLLFLEPFTVASPKLYAMYHLPGTKHVCLVMERRPGGILSDMWPGLNEDQKTIVCNKLRAIFAKLRELPPPGFYGGIGGNAVPHHMFYDFKNRTDVCGPFKSAASFNAGLRIKLRELWEENGLNASRLDYYDRHMDGVLGGHAPVFTHGDLQRKNVLVTETLDVTLIDWEEAGWYPYYWEFSIKFITMDWDDDWPRRLEEIVQPCACEAAFLALLHRDLLY